MSLCHTQTVDSRYFLVRLVDLSLGAINIDNVIPVEVILRGVYGGGEQGRETLQAHGQGRRRLRHQECKHATQTQIISHGHRNINRST